MSEDPTTTDLTWCYHVRSSDEGVSGRLEQRPAPIARDREVVIRVSHSSINYKDAIGALGRAPILRNLPMVAGIDAVGDVVSSRSPVVPVGTRAVVTGFGLGEDIDGGYSQLVRIPAEWVVPLDTGGSTLSNWEAMALGTAGLTSALAIARLEQHGLTPGEHPVAVTGAGGGSGALAVAMLAGLGHDVVAFTGSHGARELLADLGAAEVRGRPDVSDTKPLGSAQWAGAVDTVGGPVLGWLTRTLAPGGSVASFGNAAGNETPMSVLPFILRSVNVLGVNTGWFDDDLRRELWRRMAGDLRPAHLDRIADTVPLSGLEPAMHRLLDGDVTGRLVVDIDS